MANSPTQSTRQRPNRPLRAPSTIKKAAAARHTAPVRPTAVTVAPPVPSVSPSMPKFSRKTWAIVIGTAALLLVLLFVAVSGHHGGSSASSGGTPVKNDVSSSFCEDLASAGDLGSADVLTGEMSDTLRTLAAEAPSEIKDDLKVLAKYSSPTDDSVGEDEATSAAQNLDEYAASHCD